MNLNSSYQSPSRESRFAWYGVDAAGRKKHGLITAIDIIAARAALKRQHIVPIKVIRKGLARVTAIRAAEVTLFSRQLASLLQAGLPLLPALEVIATSQARPSLTRIVNVIIHDISQGMHFSAALARHPNSFGKVYRQLVMVGETSGALAALLKQIADDRERAAAQRAKLRAALSYPAGVLLVSLAITVALMVWVVPTFQQIFEGFDVMLPTPTRIVLSLSNAVKQGAIPAAVLIAILILFTRFLRRSTTAFSHLRALLDQLLLKLPIIGPLFRQLAIARWSRALGLLLKAGIPLADAFETLSKVTNNAVFDRATVTIAQQVRRGERLVNAMRATGCFPAVVLQPIAVAEESGALDTMLNDLAVLNDRQMDDQISAFSSFAEPLVIVVLGTLIGGLVIAMYLPIIQIGNVV